MKSEKFYGEIEDLVSIIVPIYNVEDYLEQCIVSLVQQTYTNIEIILINDGSPDHSSEICLKWQKKDNRIIYVSKKNERLGPTRTLGIQLARGKYIMFVDSDDWIEKDYVMLLHHSIKKHDADFAFCDVVEWYGEKYKYALSSLEIKSTVSFHDDPTILFSIRPAMWNKIYKKNLFVENEILIPPYDSEEFCVFPAIVYHAKKISQVRRPLYHYRKTREGNIVTTGSGMCDSFPYTVNYACEYAVAQGIWEELKPYLRIHFTKQFLFCFYKGCETEEFRECVNDDLLEEAYKGIERYYPDWKQRVLHHRARYILFGNAMIRNTVSYLNPVSSFFSGRYLERFHFSSMISLFGSDIICDEEDIAEENTFRAEMLVRENQKKLLQCLQSSGKDFYLLFDLLEERYDIWEYQGCYRTMNPMNHKLFESIQKGRIIKRDSGETALLWDRSCKRFVELVKLFQPVRIIMLKNFASASMRDYGTDLSENIINRILEGYYDDMQRLLPEIQVFHDAKEIFAFYQDLF